MTKSDGGDAPIFDGLADGLSSNSEDFCALRDAEEIRLASHICAGILPIQAAEEKDNSQGWRYKYLPCHWAGTARHTYI